MFFLLTDSPLPSLLRNTATPPPHLNVLEEPSVDRGSREERKERKWNSAICHGTRGNMINSHSVCCTLHMALHWCMYRENNKPWTTPHQVYSNCDFHYCSKYLKYLVNTFTSILNHAFWPITHKALHNKLGHSFPSAPLPYLPHQKKTRHVYWPRRLA